MKTIDSSLGEKIKRYRKRMGLSQLQLEAQAGFSEGSVSRIEKGKVNPNKESIDKMSKIFKLDLRDKDYLLGEYKEENLEKDIVKAKEELENYMNRKDVFAYLVDEKYRVWYGSRGFQKVLGTTESGVKSLYGLNLLELMVNPKLPVFKIINTKDYQDRLRIEFVRFRKEVPFWNIDDYCIKIVQDLKKRFPIFSQIWVELGDDFKEIYDNRSRRVKFRFLGKDIDMDFSREYLKSNSRFVFVTYIVNNKILRLISQLF